MMDLHSTSRPFGFLILAAGLYGIWSVRLTSDVSLTTQLNPSKQTETLRGEIWCLQCLHGACLSFKIETSSTK
jgi:hypothetical protein